MKLTYFGEEYYERSGSIIGVLYTHDGERSDWGKVNVALRNGESVEITPASPAQHRAIEAQTVRAIERAKAAGFGGPWGPPKANKPDSGTAESRSL